MYTNQPTGNIALPGLKQYTPETEAERHENRRVSVISGAPATVRKHIVAFVGELVGTFCFLFFAFAATQIANSPRGQIDSTYIGPDVSALLYIALAFGFSLAVNVWIFFRITGGVFNPAVTLGLCLIDALPWFRGAVIFVAQLLGAILASALVSGLFPGEMSVQTGLSPGTSIARGVFIEMFCTAELIFTIFMLAVEKNKSTFVAPIGVGLALFIAELAAVYFTGGSLNPARSFGPAVILGSFVGYHWIYWVGPFLGALLAVGFYKIVKGLEYETVNPGQDMNDKEAETFRDDEAPHDAPVARRFDGSASFKSVDRGSNDEKV